jgi:transposase
MLGTQDRWQDDLFIVGCLRDLIPDDHLLRRVDRHLDLSWLRSDVADCYCEDNGRPGIDPEAAVRLMLAGFLSGIVHDRRLIREAQVNLAIRWFAGYRLHESLPDHSSLTRIRQRWGEQRFRRLFERTVQLCVNAGLVAGDMIHVDATLVRADVSLNSLVRRHIDNVLATNSEGALLQGAPHMKQKPRVVSTTDPDCAMATSSRRTFSEPSYKQHIAVDDRAAVIVDVAVTRGDVNEGNLIEGHVDRTEMLTGRQVKTITADSGYAYGKVYAAMEVRGVDAIIPAKAEPPPTGVIPVRRFKYDAHNQIVRCPEGKVLRRSTKTWHGWFYKASTGDCKHCRLRSSCLSPTVGRRSVVISDGHAALLRARRRRLRWSAHEYSAYARHRWRSEGVNAEVKRWHGSRRAVRRGLNNMAIQAYLTAATINLKRLTR